MREEERERMREEEREDETHQTDFVVCFVMGLMGTVRDERGTY